MREAHGFSILLASPKRDTPQMLTASCPFLPTEVGELPNECV